jgi:homoserine dehydrogenase
MQEINIALMGFGNVGKALADLFIDKKQTLLDQYNLSYRVTGIATGRHGIAVNPQGIDLQKALDLAAQGESLTTLSAGELPEDSLAFIRQCGADVLFENTPVNYQSGQPAIDHIQTALENGMHAITANKGPIVHAFDRLTAIAKQHNRQFLFESTVMDGAPVFGLWRETLPAADIVSFEGILNSTTNLVLRLMEDGKPFEDAITVAKSIGIAESDPQGDTQGWDAAIKVAALVTVLMGIPLKPDQVDREGIEKISLDDVTSAAAERTRWKLLCRAEKRAGEIHASVRPALVGPDNPLFNVQGTSCAITFQSDVLGDLTLVETDPSPKTTAYGLFADFINTLRSTSG